MINWNAFGAFVIFGWLIMYVIVPLCVCIYFKLKHKKKMSDTFVVIGEEMMKNEV